MSQNYRNSGGGRKRGHDAISEGLPYSKAMEMMVKMGWRGKGLGKDEQGIEDPIPTKQKKGRQGLGHHYNFEKEIQEEVPPGLEWDTSEEIVLEESVQWIPPLINSCPDFHEFESEWLRLGEKKETIDDETEFVDREILKWILKCKSAFDDIEGSDFNPARDRTNPYEAIKKGIFMNRAAMKMANMDAILDYEITNPKSLCSEEHFYFADICAGPGGFSEYILWRKGWIAKGFGFTLKGDCDFKLHDFVAGTPESFEPFYGPADDGDIYNPVNCEAFINYVLNESDGLGVHLTMADGGFSVKGQENIQEILSKQLYLSQAFVAVRIVREGGTFVCKLFDCFTAFSVGLIYLMRFVFEEVAIIKPLTSRPANSERYLVCKRKKSEAIVLPICQYLEHCHRLMWEQRQTSGAPSGEDVVDLVPLKIIKKDKPFFGYIKSTNDKMGQKQVQNLRRIVSYFVDPAVRIPPIEQQRVKIDCLRLWGFDPGQIRKSKETGVPQDKFFEILNMTSSRRGFEKIMDRTFVLDAKEHRSPYDWKICVVQHSSVKRSRGFFLSLGGNSIFRFDGYSKWEPLSQISCQKFQMADNTLIYGEIVEEYAASGNDKYLIFHIIDGLILGGRDIRGLSLNDRNFWCRKFAKSMSKTPSVSDCGGIKAKELIPLEDYPELQQSLRHQILPGCGKVSKLVAPTNRWQDSSPCIQANGILFLLSVQEPWLKAFSKSQQKPYYFNTRTNHKDFISPPQAHADFCLTMEKRMFWDLNARSESGTAQILLDYLQEIETNGVK